MSKAFDEGGAKGLLLANLGVGSEGCNIVFDSSSSDPNDGTAAEEEASVRPEGMVDISSLTAKLGELLQEDSVDQLQLVPQLTSLRAEHSQLEVEGYCPPSPDCRSGQRRRRENYYGVSEEEETLADRSIHKEAQERSRYSLARSVMDEDDEEIVRSRQSSLLPSPSQPPLGTGDDDSMDEGGVLGGGAFDDGISDYDDDDGGDPFGARFSTSSFDRQQGTAALLDALSTTQSLWTTDNDNAYWKSEVASGGNQWAGVAHWKATRKTPGKTPRKPAVTPGKTPGKGKRMGATNRQRVKGQEKEVLVDLAERSQEEVDSVLFPSSKGKKVMMIWTKTTIAKHARNDNVLPLDAGIAPEQMISLFLRPAPIKTESIKTVGFADEQDCGGFVAFDDYGGDDDDGPGFAMNDNDEPLGDDQDKETLFLQELEGIRKVEKVHVGYATVAKKVDVKRLKLDLWDELHERLDERAARLVEKKETNKSDEDDDKGSLPGMEAEPCATSFFEAVQDMEQRKTSKQADVTLPFYFICILHLANEKGLRLESRSLDDFDIFKDEDASPAV